MCFRYTCQTKPYYNIILKTSFISHYECYPSPTSPCAFSRESAQVGMQPFLITPLNSSMPQTFKGQMTKLLNHLFLCQLWNKHRQSFLMLIDCYADQNMLKLYSPMKKEQFKETTLILWWCFENLKQHLYMSSAKQLSMVLFNIYFKCLLSLPTLNNEQKNLRSPSDQAASKIQQKLLTSSKIVLKNSQQKVSYCIILPVEVKWTHSDTYIKHIQAHKKYQQNHWGEKKALNLALKYKCQTTL